MLDYSEEVAGSICYHSVELTTPQSVVSKSDTVVPDADHDHDASDVHLLQDGQELFSAALFSIVVEPLGEHLSLLHRVELVDTVGEDPVLGRCELRAGLRIRHVAQVVDHETHLVFVGNRRRKRLELQLFVLLALATRNALNDGFKLLLVDRCCIIV